MLRGGPDDLPQPGRILTIGAAKFAYSSLLECFIAHPDKLFVVVTAPPVPDATWADNARDFTTWLVNDWLVENEYPDSNVVVFDLYNVLTQPENHHRFNPSTGQVDHIVSYLENTLYYNGENDRADVEGSQKATEEFVPLLNYYYNRWKANPAAPVSAPCHRAEPGCAYSTSSRRAWWKVIRSRTVSTCTFSLPAPGCQRCSPLG